MACLQRTQGDEVVGMVNRLADADTAECERISESAATTIDKYQEGSYLLDAYLGSLTVDKFCSFSVLSHISVCVLLASSRGCPHTPRYFITHICRFHLCVWTP